MKNRCVSAFTLIELRVVIVVIGLLAGSKSIRCGSNMRQISLSVTMHDDEREGAMPIATNFAEPELSPQRICVTALARFLGNREVFLCPSAPNAQFGGDWAKRSWHPIGYNGATTFDPRGVEGPTTKPKLVSVQELSLAVLFADTPCGPIDKKYWGYVFSPKNGKRNRFDPRRSTPLLSDPDVVAEMSSK